MDTSFALKEAVDRIQRTIDRVKLLNKNADTIVKALGDKIDLTANRTGSFNTENMDISRLMDLFSQLSEEDIYLEVIALGNLLDAVLGSNDVIVVCVNEKDDYKSSDKTTHLIYQLAKGLFGFNQFCTEEDKPILSNYLNRFRYKPELLDAIKPFIPVKLYDDVTNDYKFNFIKYAKAVYDYYYEFYKRGEGIDEDMLETIDSLRNEEKIDYIIKESKFSRDSLLEFKFKATLSKPIEHIIEELEVFRETVALAMLNMYEEKKSAYDRPYHILADYIRDNSGKIVDHEKLSKMFKRWQRILDVYVLRHEKGMTYGQIKSKLGIPDPRKDFLEAQRLILSATQGMFPE